MGIFDLGAYEVARLPAFGGESAAPLFLSFFSETCSRYFGMCKQGYFCRSRIKVKFFTFHFDSHFHREPSKCGKYRNSHTFDGSIFNG